MASILLVLHTTAFAFIEDSEARREILKMRMQIEDLEKSIKEVNSIIDGYKVGQILLLNRIEEFSKEFLCEIPIDPEVGKSGDQGKPIVESNPDNEISKIYLDIAKKIKSSFIEN